MNEIKVNHKNLKRKLNKVEWQNEDMKQKIINLEDKMLEHNIVISGISEDNWEESEPHRGRLTNNYPT